MLSRRRRAGRSKPRWMWVVALAGLLLSCGPGRDEHSGGDEQRMKAQPLPFGVVVDDRAGARFGDATDWKRFRLDASDDVTLSVYWDDPDVDAAVSILNVYGNGVIKKAHTRGEGVDHLSASLEKGDYFVSIEAEGDGSVYSLELVTGQPGSGGAVRRGYSDPRPE